MNKEDERTYHQLIQILIMLGILSGILWGYYLAVKWLLA